MKCTFAKSPHGAVCLINDNKLHYRNHVLSDGKTVWRCLGKKCGAKIKTEGDEIVSLEPHKITCVNFFTLDDEVSKTSMPDSDNEGTRNLKWEMAFNLTARSDCVPSPKLNETYCHEGPIGENLRPLENTGYNKKSKTAHKMTKWHCTDSKCSAKMITNKDSVIEAEPHTCIKFSDTPRPNCYKYMSKPLAINDGGECDTEPYCDNESDISVNEVDLTSDSKVNTKMNSASEITNYSNSFSNKKDGLRPRPSLENHNDDVSPNSKTSPSKRDGSSKVSLLPVTYAERNTLLDLIEKYYDVIIGPVKERPKLWQIITGEYNEMTTVKRTGKQIRKFWGNVKLKVKKQLAAGGLEAIANLPPHELRSLSLIHKEFFSDLFSPSSIQTAIDDVKMGKNVDGNNFDHGSPVYEIVMDDSNSFSEEDAEVATEEENPLAVSTADYSSMDEQISFAKDPFQIRHVQDVSNFSSTLSQNSVPPTPLSCTNDLRGFRVSSDDVQLGCDQDHQKTSNSIYQEEHFYDLDDEPSLEDTPDVHVTDIPDNDIEVPPNSPLTNVDFSQIEMSKLMENSVSDVVNINSVEITTGDAGGSSQDPLFINSLSETTMAGINTSESNSFFAVNELQNLKMKVLNSEESFRSGSSLRLIRPKLGPADSKVTTPSLKNIRIAPRVNILSQTFKNLKSNAIPQPLAKLKSKPLPKPPPKLKPKPEQTRKVEEKSMPKIKISENIFETERKSSPQSINPFAPQMNLLPFDSPVESTMSSIAAIPPTFSGATGFNTSFKVNSNTQQQGYIISTASNISNPTNTMFRPPFPVNVENPSQYAFSHIPLSNTQESHSSKTGTSEEYLTFSKDYIYKRMKMEQTKFDFKMENLTKERDCLKERHDMEMKVLQLKLKYVSAQYEEMLKRNRWKNDNMS